MISFFRHQEATRATINSLRSRVYNSQRQRSNAAELLAVSVALQKLITSLHGLLNEEYVINKLKDYDEMAGTASFGAPPVDFPAPARSPPKRPSVKRSLAASLVDSNPLAPDDQADRKRRLVTRRRTLLESITLHEDAAEKAKAELQQIDIELGALVEDVDED